MYVVPLDRSLGWLHLLWALLCFCIPCQCRTANSGKTTIRSCRTARNGLAEGTQNRGYCSGCDTKATDAWHRQGGKTQLNHDQLQPTQSAHIRRYALHEYNPAAATGQGVYFPPVLCTSCQQFQITVQLCGCTQVCRVCAESVLSLGVCENRGGWLVARGLYGCMLVRFLLCGFSLSLFCNSHVHRRHSCFADIHGMPRQLLGLQNVQPSCARNTTTCNKCQYQVEVHQFSTRSCGSSRC